MNIVISAVLIIFGLILGSFAGAQVWRLRARQLAGDKADGEEYDKKELARLKPLLGGKLRDDHSRCLRCKHQLHAIDLIPLISWLSTGGKCRYCHKPIGYFEPLMELGTAALFVATYLLWPYGFSGLGITLMIVWLAATVLLVMLFAYDLKWFLLPNVLVFAVIALGVVASILTLLMSTVLLETATSILFGVVILSGIYGLLWLISSGAWIGFGDVKLGLGLALLLADWRLSFFALFAANLIGCLIVLPGLATGKIKRTTRVPFGPLLIAGAYIALFFGAAITRWYLGLL